LEVECNTVVVKENGSVYVEGEKKEIMKNKHKLKGGRIFIENDLRLERKIQEKMNR